MLLYEQVERLGSVSSARRVPMMGQGSLARLRHPHIHRRPATIAMGIQSQW